MGTPKKSEKIFLEAKKGKKCRNVCINPAFLAVLGGKKSGFFPHLSEKFQKNYCNLNLDVLIYAYSEGTYAELG